MRYLFILLITGCSYNNICPYQLKIAELNKQIAIENDSLRILSTKPFTSDTAENLLEHLDNIESLEIEKLTYNCK